MAKHKKKSLGRALPTLLLAVLLAGVAGAGVGMWRRSASTPVAVTTVTKSEPVAKATKMTKAAPPTVAETKPEPPPKNKEAIKPKVPVKPKVVVEEIIRDPFLEVSGLLDPARTGKEPTPGFLPEQMRDYAEDTSGSQLRVVVRDSIKQLQGMEPLLTNRRLNVTKLPGGKKLIVDSLDLVQKKSAADRERLNGLLVELQGQAGDYQREPRRWRANYDFITSRVLARLILQNELSFQLQVMRSKLSKGEAVSPLGWDLVPDPKLVSGEDVDELVQERERLLKRLNQDHKGTPWQQVSDREMNLPLGIRVRPTVKK